MYYLIWLSSKGGKELYTIVSNAKQATYLVTELYKYYKETGSKTRAYFTICEEGKPYYHKEIK